jgi:hypothetical protein
MTEVQNYQYKHQIYMRGSEIPIQTSNIHDRGSELSIQTSNIHDRGSELLIQTSNIHERFRTINTNIKYT